MFSCLVRSIMRVTCIACNKTYLYRDEDEDCTKYICSFCFSEDLCNKSLSKWSRLRFRILNRDSFTCKYCGDSPTKNASCILHIDHVRPYSKGGTNSEKNLITACAVCNLGKLHFELNEESNKHIFSYLEEERTEEKLNENKNS